MSVRLRLQRHGSKKNPFYRVVASDQRAPRDGRYIEQLGVFHPLIQEASVLNLDLERVDYWLGTGAIASERVSKLIEKARSGNVQTIQEYENARRAHNKSQREAALKGVAVIPAPKPKAEEKPAEAPAEAAEAAPETDADA